SLPPGSATSVYWLPSSCTKRKLPPETSLRRCRIPPMPASATAVAAARTEPPNSASPPTTCPSIIMTIPASRATGTTATSRSASSGTASTALADLSGARSTSQPVTTLTSQGQSPSRARATRYVVSFIVNAPLDQNHPVAVRRGDRGRAGQREYSPARSGRILKGLCHRHGVAGRADGGGLAVPGAGLGPANQPRPDPSDCHLAMSHLSC